jgi:hypothetical protein
MRVLIRISAIALFAVIMFAGIPVYAQAVNVNMQLSPALEMAQVVYISNFGFLDEARTQDLFQVTISNSTGTKFGRFVLEVSKDGERIVRTYTNEFELSNGVLSYSNIQLNMGVEINGTNIFFDDSETDYPTEDFQNEVYSGGKLPRGRYVFMFGFEVDNQLIGSDSRELLVLNPTYVEPVSPFNKEEVNNEFPLFQFNSDLQEMVALTEEPFRVRIYEKPAPPPALSLDEVQTSDNLVLDMWTGQKVFQYPQAGDALRPLEFGKSYVWVVDLKINTSNGAEFISSPLSEFTLIDPASGDDGANKAGGQNVSELLRDLIGSRADQVVSSLGNYSLKTIRVNGQSMTVEEIYQLIDSYEGHLIEISDLLLQSTQN